MPFRRFASIVLLLLAAGIGRAQDSAGFFMGPVAGYGIGIQGSERLPVYAGFDECGVFTGGSGQEFSYGFHLLAPSFFSSGIGLAGELTVIASRGALVASPRDPLLVYDETTGEGLEVGHEYRFNHESQQLALALTGTYAFGSGGSVRLGAWGGYRYQGRLWQIDTITSGLLRFDSLPDPSAREMIEGERLSLNRTAFGAIAGVSWRWRSPFWSRVWLQPEVSVRADLLSFSNERRWQAFGGGFSLALLVDVSPVPADPPPVDTFPPDRRLPPSMPRAGRVTAQIDLYGTDENDRRLPAALIRVFETYRRVRTGRLDEIRFEQGKSALPQYYPELSRSAAGAFSADSISAASPVDLRRQTLNIIGERMTRHATASIILNGSILRGERSALGIVRAGEVKRYLRDVWGIDSGRMDVGAENGAERGGNAQVRIASNDPEITRPAVMERVERSLDPPLIALDPVYEADAGVRRWEIVLNHDGREIGRIRSTDTSDEAAARLDWQIVEGESGPTHSMLTADLTVEDSVGTVISARSQTPLTIERQTRVADRWEMENGAGEMLLYTLYPFEPGSAALRERNREVLREIASATRGRARLSVIDAAGTELSARRAETVADLLRSALGGRNARVSISRDASAVADAESVLAMSSARAVLIVVEQGLPAVEGR